MGKSDQRSAKRFAMDLPIEVKFSGDDAPSTQALTKDVSSRGVFFYANAAMEPGSAVEFEMVLPWEVTLAAPVRIRCKGKIVRVDQVDATDKHRGVVVAIDKYDFVPEE